MKCGHLQLKWKDKTSGRKFHDWLEKGLKMSVLRSLPTNNGAKDLIFYPFHMETKVARRSPVL